MTRVAVRCSIRTGVLHRQRACQLACFDDNRRAPDEERKRECDSTEHHPGQYTARMLIPLIPNP